MRMKELKALEKITKNPPRGIMRHEGFDHIWMCEQSVYACNAATLVEVKSWEIKGDNPCMFEWQALDLVSCVADEMRNRFVNLNDTDNLIHDRSQLPNTSRWDSNYFSKLFDTLGKLCADEDEHEYDVKQMALVVNVFNAFGINPRFKMVSQDCFMVSGNNANYDIRALIAPRKVRK